MALFLTPRSNTNGQEKSGNFNTTSSGNVIRNLCLRRLLVLPIVRSINNREIFRKKRSNEFTMILCHCNDRRICLPSFQTSCRVKCRFLAIHSSSLAIVYFAFGLRNKVNDAQLFLSSLRRVGHRGLRRLWEE